MFPVCLHAPAMARILHHRGLTNVKRETFDLFGAGATQVPPLCSFLNSYVDFE